MIRRGIPFIVSLLFLLGFGTAQRAQAQVESMLHIFSGSDGFSPNGPIRDSAGNLYGTTGGGGPSTNCNGGCGTVFEMVYDSATNSYTQKVLYNFTGTDGAYPSAGLVRDSAGNLYGTTAQGGSTYTSSSSPGDGTVFELIPDSSSAAGYDEKVLHSFTGSDGAIPQAPLVRDGVGNLYGTTRFGGSSTNCNNGCGTVFELVYTASTNAYTEELLHNFTGSDGADPQAGLIMDSSGNLYGTTEGGGSSGDGIVFELVRASSFSISYSEKVLHSFTGSEGAYPVAGLVRDSSSNLYGTTGQGGSSYSSSATLPSDGAVFELVPDSSSPTGYSEKVLYSFTGSDGLFPQAGLVRDSAGNFYGTTFLGGSTYSAASQPLPPSSDGTVFELVPDHSSSTGYSERVLHSFTGSDGEQPMSDLIIDLSGNLYGTTFGGSGGPAGDGTVFGIAPVTLSATSLIFGSVGVDTTSAAQSVTVTNIGDGNFRYNAVSLSGTNAADFAITTNGCSNAVSPNGNCSVSVTFTPSTATAETASLNLSQGGMTQVVNLTGTGVYPTASVSASSLTFSSQDVGSTSSSQTVTVTNSSTVPLTVSSVGINGDFAIDSNTCTTSVAAGKTCTVGVTFTPTASGARTGTLSITDNAASSPQTIALSGKGEDFTLGMASGSSSSATVSPGGSASYTLTLAPEGGFNQAVNLACSGAPANATCTVSPASDTLDGKDAATVKVTATTTAASMLLPPEGPTPFSGQWPEALLLAALGLLAFAVWRKLSPRTAGLRRLRWTMVAGFLLLVASLAACGGGSSSSNTVSNPGTKAGTYTLTVTGTSGNLQHSTSLTLTVK